MAATNRVPTSIKHFGGATMYVVTCSLSLSKVKKMLSIQKRCYSKKLTSYKKVILKLFRMFAQGGKKLVYGQHPHRDDDSGDSLNQIRRCYVYAILKSYKIRAGTAPVCDAIFTTYSDFTANCTSIQVQIHKCLIPSSRMQSLPFLRYQGSIG